MRRFAGQFEASPDPPDSLAGCRVLKPHGASRLGHAEALYKGEARNLLCRAISQAQQLGEGGKLIGGHDL